MCLYPIRIRNPKYLPNKKNNYNPPKPIDKRLLWVETACGYCYECQKQKANSWRFRLEKEIKNKNNKACKFITLTFSEEALDELKAKTKSEDNNIIAKVAVKLFRERWRKQYKKSPKHWFITELGGEYGRIHLHGILFEETTSEELSGIWKYGFVYIGDYVNAKTINYIIKYLYKQSDIDRKYTPIVLTSPGIGKQFMQSRDAKRITINDTKVRLKNGTEIEAPTYYKQRLLNDREREILHLKNVLKDETWIDGIRIRNNIDNDSDIYINTLRKQAIDKYHKIGYLSEIEIDMIKSEKKRKKK